MYDGVFYISCICKKPPASPPHAHCITSCLFSKDPWESFSPVPLSERVLICSHSSVSFYLIGIENHDHREALRNPWLSILTILGFLQDPLQTPTGERYEAGIFYLLFPYRDSMHACFSFPFFLKKNFYGEVI